MVVVGEKVSAEEEVEISSKSMGIIDRCDELHNQLAKCWQMAGYNFVAD